MSETLLVCVFFLRFEQKEYYLLMNKRVLTLEGFTRRLLDGQAV